MPLRIVADCHPRFAAKTSSVDSSLARSWRGFVDEQVGRYLDCGLFENGFARIRCPECREEYLLAFSCKTRELCPSCAAKRSAATAALLALEHARKELTTPDEAVRYIQTVTLAFNTHQPRGLGLTLPQIADFPISDAETAGRLGELLGISASMVRQYVGPEATPEQITEVGTHLFRHIYLDPGWGLTYLDQYYVGVAWIAGLPPSERRPYLEK